ncbi:MAG: type 1 glutamine amidotransferase domain-containing protein [Candidatus Scalinduaceae bacterium]
MKLKRKTVAVLVEDLYQELEVWYPILRLRETGAKVIVVGTGTKKVYLSKLGYEVKADTEAKKVKDIDGIIIPGGYAPDRLRRYEPINKLVRNTFHKNKVVAAICHGAWVLVSANVLKGRKTTCFSAIKDDVVNAGGKYVDREVVVDGNLITSRKPEDLPAFMKAIIKALA